MALGAHSAMTSSIVGGVGRPAKNGCACRSAYTNVDHECAEVASKVDESSEAGAALEVEVEPGAEEGV